MKTECNTHNSMCNAKGIAIIFFLILIWFLLPRTALAATYYVDVDSVGGACSGAYTKAENNTNSPWCTINHGVSQLSPGDTLLVRGGVYREEVNIGVSGTAQERITIKNYPNEKPVLEGSVPITGWQKCQSAAECGNNINWNNIYYADIAYDLSKLGSVSGIVLNPYQDDEMLPVSQYPNPSDPVFMDNSNDYATVPSADMATTKLIHSFFSNFAPNDLDSSYMFSWVDRSAGELNVWGWAKITNFILSENKAEYQSLGINVREKNGMKYFSIANSLNSKVLDLPGEYYLDEATKRLYLWPLKDPSQSNITISVLHRAVTTNDYVTFEGFRIQKYMDPNLYSTSIVSDIGSVGHIFRNNEVAYLMGMPGGAVGFNSSNIRVENNVVDRPVRMRGIEITNTSDVWVVNNTINKSGETAIRLNSLSNIHIHNNTIYDARGTHSNGISTYFVNTGEVSGNKVYRSARSYAVQQSSNLVIANNIFDAQEYVHQVFASWGNVQALVINNIIVGDNINCAVEMHSGGNNYVFKNNIIEGTGLHPQSAGTKFSGTLQHTHNIYTAQCSDPWFDEFYDYSGWGANEFLETNLNKIFLDPSNHDWHLKEGSPAIDAGSPELAPNVDIEGNPRPQGTGFDIGAYEYISNLFFYGDVSGNSKITAYDAALTAQAAENIITLTLEQTQKAEVSGDSEITAYDAALIAQRAVGLIEKFPIEQ